MSLTHHLPRILVIDADLDAIEMARFTLWRNQLPCQFEWFDDAELANASLLTQALCRARDLPTLILLDPRSFPGTEGYELLRTLDLRLPPETIATGLPATPPMNVYTDRTGNARGAFYRVRVE